MNNFNVLQKYLGNWKISSTPENIQFLDQIEKLLIKNKVYEHIHYIIYVGDPKRMFSNERREYTTNKKNENNARYI